MGTGLLAEPRIRETHTAVLIFAGDRVYKVKKPVDLGFVDFRTPKAALAAAAAVLRSWLGSTPD